VTRIPVNSAGKSTSITTTGCVEEVAFTWSWSVGETMWVDDAVLTIVGAKFQTKLEHVERTDDEDSAAAAHDDNHGEDLRKSFVNPSTIDAASARQIKTQKGGVGGFVERQVKMVMDMLTLKLVDFELRIIIPQPPQLADDVGISSSNACNKVLVVGGDKIEVLSFGRDGQDGTVADTPTKLKQRINLNSFFCGIHLEGKENNNKIISYPLVEPFSYSANVARLGERFGGFLTGMEVLGLGQPIDLCPDLSSLTGSGLAFHMGKTQIDFLMQLSVMILAPPNDNTTSAEEKTEELSKLSKKESTDSDANISGTSEPSSFTFPLSSASLVLFEEMKFVVSGITMRYTADGTVCSVDAARMEYDSDANGQAAASQILISMRPAMKMTIGCIDTLFVKDTFLLSTPIESTEISYEGSTLMVKLDAIDGVTFSKKKDATQTGATISAPNLPFNINLDIQKGMQIKKSEDGALTKFGRFHLYGLKEESCTKVAIQFESFRNYLVSSTTVSFCGSLPLNQSDVINDFIFTAGEVKIMSGHSTDEWYEAFAPRKAPKVKQPTTEQSKTAIRVPFANIGVLKVVIGLEGSHKIGRVKDTSLVIKAFKGKAETTFKDLTKYYTKACMSRAPDFISNAEVLGLNVVDSTTGLWATWAGAGLGLGSAFGAGAGVAGKVFSVLFILMVVLFQEALPFTSVFACLLAITGVDAIKGAVDAGKRSRSVSEQENWKPGDFMRGLVQAAGEATRDGATMRGKLGGGNLIDWTFGATANTTEYVVENKNRLGAAGAGGGGFLLGMALGGPIGAIVGGLVATATTGVALESLDEVGQRIQTQQIEDSKEKSKIKK